MKKVLLGFFVVLFALAGQVLANGGPNCTSPTVISGSPYTDSGNFDGVNDCTVTGIDPPYNDMFYRFTPSNTGNYQFRLRDYGASVIPAIRIVSGACCTSGTSVSVFYSGSSISSTCYNPTGSGNEPVTVVTYARAMLTAGTQYWIQVGTDSATASTVAYDFMMTCIPCPNWETLSDHSTCGTAQALAYPDSVTGRAGEFGIAA